MRVPATRPDRRKHKHTRIRRYYVHVRETGGDIAGSNGLKAKGRAVRALCWLREDVAQNLGYSGWKRTENKHCMARIRPADVSSITRS
jgi:hypothetical protein